MSAAVVKRLYVGGLFNGVTDADLRERFGRFGDVLSVNIKSKQASSGDVMNTFAYVDFNVSEENYKKCLSTYQKAKWKGHELKLQMAKESFISKLKKELESPVSPPPDVTPQQSEDDVHQKVRDIVVKGAPGTKVDSMKDWVVGKYGRILPVVRIRRKDKKKIMMFDPSKHCHLVKKLETETDPLSSDRHVTELTWQIADRKQHPQDKLAAVNSRSASKKKTPVSAIKQPTDDVVGGINSVTLTSEGGSKIVPVVETRSNDIRSEAVMPNDCLSAMRKINDSTKIVKVVSTAAAAAAAAAAGAGKQLKKNPSVPRDGQTATPSSKVKQAKTTISNTGSKLLTKAVSKKSDNIDSHAELKVVEFFDNEDDDHVAGTTLPVADVKPGVYSGLDSAAVVDEFSDGLRDMTQQRQRFTDYYSDDDVFDLIETGRVQDLLRKSPFGLREPTKHKALVKSLNAVKQNTSTFRTLSSLPLANEPASRKTDGGYDSGDSADTDIVIQRVKHKADAVVNNSQSAEQSSVQLMPGTDVVGNQDRSGHISATIASKKPKKMKKRHASELNTASTTSNLKAVKTSASCKKESCDQNNLPQVPLSVNGSISSKQLKKEKKKNINKSQDESGKNNPLQVLNSVSVAGEEMKSTKNCKILNHEAPREIQSIADSSDEDVFELIESGRVTELYQKSASCSDLLSVSFNSEDIDSDVDDIDVKHRSKMTGVEYDSSDSADTDIIIQRHKSSSTGVENISLQNTATAVLNAAVGSLQYPVRSPSLVPCSSPHSASAAVKQVAKLSSSTPCAISPHSVAADNVKAASVAESVDKKKKMKQKKRSSLKSDDEISSAEQTNSMSAAAALTNQAVQTSTRRDTENLSKKSESNKKRLASMKERAEASATQKSAIHQALTNIDVGKSKRIVFDSDSDDGFVDDVDSVAAAVANGCRTELPAKVADKREMFLFDSDDDSLDDELNVRTEFSGAGGSKLLELQQRIGNDSRFQLDSRFRDTDIPYTMPETTEELSEKEKALRILGSVVPQSMTLKRKETKFQVVPRYDPTASNSNTMEIVKEPTIKKQKTTKSDKSSVTPAAVPSVGLPKVDQQPKFLYSASVFSESTSEKFSLFGCLPPDEDLELQADDVQAEPMQEDIQTPKQLKRTKRTVDIENDVDDVDDDDDIINESNSRVAAKSTSTTKTVHSSKSFFIIDNSEDLKASLEFFCQAHRLSSIREEWAEKRIQLVKAYRQRHKDALKRQHKTKDQKQQRRVKK